MDRTTTRSATCRWDVEDLVDRADRERHRLDLTRLRQWGERAARRRRGRREPRLADTARRDGRGMGGRVAALALTFCSALAPISGKSHDFWIETGRTAHGYDVSLRVGEALSGDAVPRIPGWFERFFIRMPHGAVEPIRGQIGDEPAGRVSLSVPGVHQIAYVSTAGHTELAIDAFVDYLKAEKLGAFERDVRSASKTGTVHEAYYRYAKHLVRAPGPEASEGGAGSPTPLGLVLEIVPTRNPLATGSSNATVQVQLRGRPLPGIAVVAMRRTNPKRVFWMRTNADGFATVPLEPSGFWLLKAVHLEPAPPGSGLTRWVTHWATLSFTRD